MTLLGTKEQFTVEWTNIMDWAIVPFSNTETSLVALLEVPLKSGKNQFKIVRFQCKDRGLAEVSFNDDQSIFDEEWQSIQEK